MLRLVVYLFLLCTSCINFDNTYGYYPDLNKIRIGNTKGEVKENLGAPSFTSAENEQTWYYISTKIIKNAITSSYHSKIVQVEFNQDGIVKDFYETSKETSPKVSRERTKGKGILAEKNLKDKIVDSIKNLRPSL